MKKKFILGFFLVAAGLAGAKMIPSGFVFAQEEEKTPVDLTSLAPELSTTIVISQVYSGGGSATAGVTYKKDYVELKNISSLPRSIAGLHLQYGSATGDFGSAATNIYSLSGNVTLQPGQYYLVELATPGTAGLDLTPAANESTTNLSMAAASGKVALTNTATALGCGTTPCTLPDARIIDLVSWGAANNAEGGAAVNNGTALPANTNGSVRKNNGCTETDNNNTDFQVVVGPAPRNTSSSYSACSTTTAPAKLFTARLKGSTEVPANNSTAIGYGRVVLNDAETAITATFYWQNLQGGPTAGHIHGSAGPAGTAGVLFDMAPAAGSTSGSKEVVFSTVTPAQVADLRAGLMYFNIHTAAFGGGEIRGQLVGGQANTPMDFNGDHKTDYALIRGSGGASAPVSWWILQNGSLANATQTQFGTLNDKYVAADYDGDGKDDITYWRGATGTSSAFNIFRSSTGTVLQVPFGQNAPISDDVYVVGDYNGDGIDDPAIYRAGASAGQPSTFWWWVNGVQFAQSWGQNGDIAVPGDYNGDGTADLCVYRSIGGQAVFFIHNGGANPGPDTIIPFGNPTQLFVPGDYDGDGKTDLAVTNLQGNAMVWYYRSSLTGGIIARSWGVDGDVETPGDFDGDGKSDPAIWRSATPAGASAFYALGSTSGPIADDWGLAGDVSAFWDVR